MTTEYVEKCDSDMEKRIQNLDRDLAKIRTGRASVGILDGIRVDYYGSPTPLNQVASLSTPDARTIVITPFEKKVISDIERAIQIADIGIQPNNDGNVVRIPIPPLTEQRRKDIAKNIRKIGEDAKIAVRKVRQDANSSVKKAEKDKEITEDDSKAFQKEVQVKTDQFVKVIDEKVAKKEKEVLTL